VEHIKKSFRERITTADMAAVAGVSASSVDRLFRKTFGITPFMHLRKTRLNAACALLREGVMSLADIAVKCGFNDQASMTRAFRMEIKITPLRYRNRFKNHKKSQAA
jgi:AraC family L-rhamnose operon regulatory protein RhaS